MIIIIKYIYIYVYLFNVNIPGFTFSKSAMETPEREICAKYV